MAYATSKRWFLFSVNVAVKGLSRDLSATVWVLPARPRTNHSPWNCKGLGVGRGQDGWDPCCIRQQLPVFGHADRRLRAPRALQGL